MELLQKILQGENSEAILSQWPEPVESQLFLKERLKILIESPKENLSEIHSIISSALFSLNLSPTLVKRLIKCNLLDLIEGLLKGKGPQISAKALGLLFSHLLSCPITGFNPSGSAYKPYKIECKRQGLQLKRSERIRYYLLSLCISSTTSVPIFSSFPVLSCKYFSFILKYLISFPQEISSCPNSNRFMDFLNGTLNSANNATPLQEIVLLIEEFIKFTEKANFIHTILTAHQESFPVQKLSVISSVKLG